MRGGDFFLGRGQLTCQWLLGICITCASTLFVARIRSFTRPRGLRWGMAINARVTQLSQWCGLARLEEARTFSRGRHTDKG